MCVLRTPRGDVTCLQDQLLMKNILQLIPYCCQVMRYSLALIFSTESDPFGQNCTVALELCAPSWDLQS